VAAAAGVRTAGSTTCGQRGSLGALRRAPDPGPRPDPALAEDGTRMPATRRAPVRGRGRARLRSGRAICPRV